MNISFTSVSNYTLKFNKNGDVLGQYQLALIKQTNQSKKSFDKIMHRNMGNINILYKAREYVTKKIVLLNQLYLTGLKIHVLLNETVLGIISVNGQPYTWYVRKSYTIHPIIQFHAISLLPDCEKSNNV